MITSVGIEFHTNEVKENERSSRAAILCAGLLEDMVCEFGRFLFGISVTCMLVQYCCDSGITILLFCKRFVC